jgi:hypothetical protein
MKMSRRTLLGATAAGATVAAVGGFEIATLNADAAVAPAVSPPGDVVGKITVGYQGWFSAAGDGAPINGWWHYGQNWGATPSPSNKAIKSWPDVRDYTRTYKTGFADLGNGQPASLFSSYDQQTVDTHFRWMQENDLDTAALQRFDPTGGEGPTRDAVTARVRNSAEAYGRKFYIMYDVSGWKSMQQQIKDDWATKMKAYTVSPAYARQNGKPVVGIWGFGFNDDNHPWPADVCLDVINWFKSQGVYVMGGTPTHWRYETDGDSRPGFLDVYHAYDMISPWMVGRIGDAAGSDWFYTNRTVGDVQDCAAHGIDYQPCVLPGDLQERQRKHGDFMWRQFYNVVRAGAPAIYISMFDEYNEGNQIAKTAESSAFAPAGAGFVTLDEDGTACSADYYLRLTGDGGRMLKGRLALTADRPTRPVVGGGTPAPSGGIALRARANGEYVVVSGGHLIAGGSGPESFTQVAAGSGIALKSSATGLYVCAEDAGVSALVANRTAVGPWETFTLVSNSDGSVSLRSAANGKYVCAEDAGAAPLIANRDAIGAWESFDLVDL